jgi:hypothetical protein
VFCAVFAMGCNLGVQDGRDFRKEFSKWWTSMFKGSIKYGSKTVFDTFMNKETGNFDDWTGRVKDLD